MDKVRRVMVALEVETDLTIGRLRKKANLYLTCIDEDGNARNVSVVQVQVNVVKGREVNKR